MAGEIQLNSTTALTEDTGAITLNNVNSATNRTNLGLGSIATQASGSINIDGGAIDGVTIGTNSAATDVRVDNLKLDGNTISSTNTDGNIVLDPNGAGNVLIGNFTLDADQTVGAGQDNMVLTYDYAQGTIGLEAAANVGTIASQDSDAVAITGGSITGTEFDLKSTGTSVYKSDGTTAVISESGGTVTVNNATLGSSVVFPVGSIVQVQSTQYTGLASMTSVAASTDYVLCNGTAGSGTEILNVSITPKFDNSKIWLQVSWCGEFNPGSNPYNSMFFLYRDSTKLKASSAGSQTTGIMPPALSQPAEDADSTMESCFFQYFDTPAVDTTLVYKVGVQMKTAGSVSTNRSIGDSNTNNYERGISSIVAIEIKQ